MVVMFYCLVKNQESESAYWTEIRCHESTGVELTDCLLMG